MARSSRQKSDSSGSGNKRLAPSSRSVRSSRKSRMSRSTSTSRSVPTSRSVSVNTPPRARRSSAAAPESARTSGRTIAEINREARANQRDERRAKSMQRAIRATRRPLIIIGCIVAAVIIVLVALAVVSRTDTFKIENISFSGADHLTSAEANALVTVPADATLLNVDTKSIENNLLRDSWIESVDIKREFPSTLQIDITERKLAAIVEIPMGSAQTIQNWAIGADGVWIMAIPDKDSELGQQISPKIYEDAESAIHITGVQVGLVPEMGKECSDANVNNALKIITGLTTQLADQIKSVTATDPESTVITLDSNVEIAFGAADNIREKERVCLEIMEMKPTVVYINVRVVDRPTYKAV